MKIIFDNKKHQAVALDENKVIGVCQFIEKENIWNIIHTEVDKAYQGQKLPACRMGYDRKGLPCLLLCKRIRLGRPISHFQPSFLLVLSVAGA